MLPTVNAALSFYLNNNPARAKSVNFFEQEKREWKHPVSKAELWNVIAYTIANTLIHYNDMKRKAFKLCELGRWEEIEERLNKKRKERVRVHPSDVASEVGKCERTVRRWVRTIKDDLEKSLIDKGVIHAEAKGKKES